MGAKKPPTSLVLKRHGWAEEAFGPQGTSVKWVLSAARTKPSSICPGNAVDFGSTAGAAALLSRANGNPIKTVYIYEQPEWTALVVGKDSAITKPEDLKGKKVAAQKGTDPYFFLLRTLASVGLSAGRHRVSSTCRTADGRTGPRARPGRRVGGASTPHGRRAELQAGSKLVYRNKDFNTYGFLNGREEFVEKYPETHQEDHRRLRAAKQWIIDNPDEAAKILADEAKLPLDVAQARAEERMNFEASGIPGDAHIAVLNAVVPIMRASSSPRRAPT